ncbi:hypothetical protein CKA32_001243 [Geitlerinema sp. FC II]|nr:hypothetical protein CKA32_001243 [Geitlerinema sp. FC II]
MQGGKFGENPTLSRSCEEVDRSLSQNARRPSSPSQYVRLRGTDDGSFSLFKPSLSSPRSRRSATDRIVLSSTEKSSEFCEFDLILASFWQFDRLPFSSVECCSRFRDCWNF